MCYRKGFVIRSPCGTCSIDTARRSCRIDRRGGVDTIDSPKPSRRTNRRHTTTVRTVRRVYIIGSYTATVNDDPPWSVSRTGRRRMIRVVTENFHSTKFVANFFAGEVKRSSRLMSRAKIKVSTATTVAHTKLSLKLSFPVIDI